MVYLALLFARMVCQIGETVPVLFDRQAETVVKGCNHQVLA